MNYYIIALLIWNLVVMFIYGIDKLMAKLRKRRISEATLLICAFLLGGFGAMFGMVLFNHKTSKIKFRILIPIAEIICLMILYLLIK